MAQLNSACLHPFLSSMFLLLKFKEKKSILEANFETACQPVWNLMLNGFVVLEANSFFLPKMIIIIIILVTMQHLVLVSLVDGRSVPLTLGSFTVTRILGWDTRAGAV